MQQFCFADGPVLCPPSFFGKYKIFCITQCNLPQKKSIKIERERDKKVESFPNQVIDI